MRATWKGAVAFGLVNVPVKLYAATGEHEVPLHQVHRKDAGRIRYAKKCSVCGETVEMRDLAKGYETDDGQMVVLTDEDLAELPLATEREISVLEFVPADQVDPIDARQDVLPRTREDRGEALCAAARCARRDPQDGRRQGRAASTGVDGRLAGA